LPPRWPKPGVVLRHRVGSNGAFREHAELPKDLPIGKVNEMPTKSKPKTKEPPPHKVDDKAARQAALAFEREQNRRESERRKEEAAREKERKRREQAIAKAETALKEAKGDHETRAEEIENDRAALDRRSEAEEARWEKQKKKLETDLRRAGIAMYLVQLLLPSGNAFPWLSASVRAFRWADGLYARSREGHLDPKRRTAKRRHRHRRGDRKSWTRPGGRIFAGVLKSSSIRKSS
jgi:colicin import membrane protein